MSKHDDDTCPHLVRASLLEAENARLKADVNELADGLRLASEVGIKIADEVTRLKAEVEAQAKRWAESEDLISHYKQQMDEAINDCQCSRLKAEVERLKEGNDCLGQMHDKEMERSAYLLEEFNRTTAWGRGLESDLSHARVEISFLKAEVKRLSAADSYLQDANEHAFEKRCDELEAEVERLTDAITKGAMTPDAKPFDEVERLKEEIQVLQNRCDFLEGRGQP